MLTAGIALVLTAVIAVSCRAEYRRLERAARRRWRELLVSVADLADPEQERITCADCRYWNGDADRAEWLPCDLHLRDMVMAGAAQ